MQQTGPKAGSRWQRPKVDAARPPSQSTADVLTSIILAIPRYLGHVIRSRRSNDDVALSGTSSRGQRVANVTDDVLADISAIQLLLSGWEPTSRHA